MLGARVWQHTAAQWAERHGTSTLLDHLLEVTRQRIMTRMYVYGLYIHLGEEWIPFDLIGRLGDEETLRVVLDFDSLGVDGNLAVVVVLVLHLNG